MLDFVRKAFRSGIELILWVNLILSAVAGGIAGYFLGQLISYRGRGAGEYAFFGVIIGSICGLLIDIIAGGFITTILSIEKNMEEQTVLLKNHFGIINVPDDKQTDVAKTKIGFGEEITILQKVALREKPGNNSEFINNLNENENVIKLQEDGEWTKVKRKSGTEGWCLSSCLLKTKN